MKIEQAYSSDCEETIDAELAYDYFWAGIIRNKRNFECPADNCNASITCANLDKLRKSMKVDPYFTTTGEHNTNCDLVNEIIKKEMKTRATNETGKERGRKHDNLPDIFCLSRPNSHNEKKNSPPKNTDSFTHEQKRQKKRAVSSITHHQTSTYYSLRAFVSKYLRYKLLGIANQRYINIKGYDISYEEMFVEIFSQNIAELPKYPRVYFGKAFIDRRKESDYSVNFDASLIFANKLARASTYISESLINEAFTKKLSLEKFNGLSKKNYPSVWAFVYGMPRIKAVNGKIYVNINISNLDYFDIRDEI